MTTVTVGWAMTTWESRPRTRNDAASIRKFIQAFPLMPHARRSAARAQNLFALEHSRSRRWIWRWEGASGQRRSHDLQVEASLRGVTVSGPRTVSSKFHQSEAIAKLG